MTKNITFFILVCNAFVCVAQNDSIARNKLKEVVVVGHAVAAEVS